MVGETISLLTVKIFLTRVLIVRPLRVWSLSPMLPDAPHTIPSFMAHTIAGFAIYVTGWVVTLVRLAECVFHASMATLQRAGAVHALPAVETGHHS